MVNGSKGETEGCSQWVSALGGRWCDMPFHRQWLMREVLELFDFYRPTYRKKGGFYTMANNGTINQTKKLGGDIQTLMNVARLVHCFSIGVLIGVPGAERYVDHGLKTLWDDFRDKQYGGYVWSINNDGVVDGTKQAYGHAFVILAASSAKIIGHPQADRMLDDILEVIESRFWDKKFGATTEEYQRDWGIISNYRGQNANMHLTEALMAAYEATGNSRLLDMAHSIANLIINRHARHEGWRVGEHFDAVWNIDRNYDGDPMLRPAGTTPGHSLEWSRLLAQLYQLSHPSSQSHEWLMEAAQALFKNACLQGWDHEKAGYFYTLDWNDRPLRAEKLWWPCCEAMAAAAYLGGITQNPYYDEWYRRVVGFIADHFIDHKHGGWFHQLDNNLQAVNKIFDGKPDFYHSIQASLIPLLPVDGSITAGLLKTRFTLL